MEQDSKKFLLDYLKLKYYDLGDAQSSIKTLLEHFTAKYAYFNPQAVAWYKLSEHEQAEVLIEFINWAEEEDSNIGEWRYE